MYDIIMQRRSYLNVIQLILEKPEFDGIRQSQYYLAEPRTNTPPSSGRFGVRFVQPLFWKN